VGAKTGIHWCHHTFNAVWGCTKVDRGCRDCYAEKLSARWGFDVWGPSTPYRLFGESHWNEPKTWNAAAYDARQRRRCFGGSMCDPFDQDWPKETRARLWKLIRETGSLDWMLLTKRPENIERLLPSDWGYGWGNVWLYASAHDQESLVMRAGILRGIPAIVRGISLEPLVGNDVDLRAIHLQKKWAPELRPIHHLIAGGESAGKAAAELPLETIDRLLEQTSRYQLPFFFKQFGTVLAAEYGYKNKKGEDPAEWPVKYQRQEIPLDGVRRCILCGCHENHACPGGCSWVPDIPDLCSRCL
jgi:protein gp37